VIDCVSSVVTSSSPVISQYSIPGVIGAPGGVRTKGETAGVAVFAMNKLNPEVRIVNLSFFFRLSVAIFTLW